jgi:hypothetical protein
LTNTPETRAVTLALKCGAILPTRLLVSGTSDNAAFTTPTWGGGGGGAGCLAQPPKAVM